MKLKIEFEPNPDKKQEWPEYCMFEYDGFGTKIMVWPRRELWVKECLSGKIIRKEFTKIFRRDKKNFYYLEKGATPPGDDFAENLIPSRWDEDNQGG